MKSVNEEVESEFVYRMLDESIPQKNLCLYAINLNDAFYIVRLFFIN